MTTSYDLGALLVGFSNYDQQVDVVCCWHGRYEEFVGQGTFDHYPTRTLEDGREITPDFVVDFSDYTLVGEICRLPNHSQGFVASVNQAKGYLALGSSVDVLLLLPHSTAAQSEKRIVDQQLLSDEQVLVVSFVRNDGDAKPCWLFGKATQLRTPTFRDAFLGEHSLDKVLSRDFDTIRVPIGYCFGQRAKYPFMNDAPPAIYTACYLWQNVFSRMLSPDDYLERLLNEESLEIEGVNVSNLLDACLAAKVRVKADWLKSALLLLVDAGLARSTGEHTFSVFYGKLRARPGGSHELHQQIAERLAKANVSDLDSTDGQIEGQTALPLDAPLEDQ